MMPSRKSNFEPERRGILYAAMAFLGFCIIMALLLGGIALYRMQHDFYAAFQGALRRQIYFSAVLMVVLFSLLYTPVSYGISCYFIDAHRGEADISSLFYLFFKPVVLIKAVGLALLRKLLIYLHRLLILLMAALAEVSLFFSFLVMSGEDIFSHTANPFAEAASFMLQSPWLIGLSILLWAVVLFLFLLGYLRLILCKYVLILYPEASVWQALKVGSASIRGHLFQTLLFYLHYGAYFMLTVLSFGLLFRRRRMTGFSVYAARLVQQGWREYCSKRSLR